MSHEGFEFRAVGGRELIQAVVDGGSEIGEGVVMAAVQGFFLEELPQAFDQVQVGRVTGQEQQFDGQARGEVLHEGAALIACIVQHQRDRAGEVPCGDLLQQFAHRCRGDVGRVANRQDFVSHGVPGGQHVVAVATGCGADEHSQRGPDAAQEGSQHEVCRVHEEHLPLSRARFLQARFEFAVQEFALRLDVLGDTFLGGTGSAATRRQLSPNV